MQTVIGLFESAHEAQKAAEQLINEGFMSSNIDVSIRNADNVLPGNYPSGETSWENGVTPASSITGNTPGSSSGFDYTTAGTEDNRKENVYGSTSSADRDHTADGDSFGDKVSKFFKNLFGNDETEAGRYTEVANRTGSVVTVHAQSKDEAERAADILDDNGAIDVNQRSAGEYGYSDFSQEGINLVDTADGNSNTLNVIKEDVEIGKKEVETGGVRLRSKIIERPVEEELRLREEKVTVQRTPVDRPATTADFENFKEGQIEMTEYAEVADVKKQARIVEEVTISKEVSERKEVVKETARDTEVEVENITGTESTGKGNKKSLF